MTDEQRETANLKEIPDTIKPPETLDLSTDGGLLCDVNTGICGPLETEKEDKQ